MSSLAPAPGWYADPGNASAQRWWDGAQWTPHVGPPAYAQPHPAEGSDPHDALHWIVPVGRSWQSIVAGYLGLICLVIWPLGPVAIGFGIWAVTLAGRRGSHGRGRAWFGIVGGIFGTLVFGYVLARA
jgi:Protein of unknown function (DUF2510)/Domain of unknown function (DUF4190)